MKVCVYVYVCLNGGDKCVGERSKVYQLCC